MRLRSQRNAGIVVRGDAVLGALFESSPRLRFELPSGGSVATDAPPPFRKTYARAAQSVSYHNNIHPLWLEELGLFLAVGHRHMHGQVDRFTAPFQFGWGYRHTLYALSPRLQVVSYSREFCLPALSRPDLRTPASR